MTEVSIITDDHNLCGEAPVWDPETNTLFWSDCVGLQLFRYNWNAKTRELVKSGTEINGCALNQPGGFVITNNSGIWTWEPSEEPKLLVTEAQGAACRMNDCIADPQGRLLAGSWFYTTQGQYPLGKLFCVETDASVRILDDGFELANGLGFSPDDKTLYFTDSSARVIYGYDYDSVTGNVRNRRIVIRVARTAGLPDGLTVDAEGYIWCAEWYGSCLARYDPDGKLERRVMVPAKQISSLAFGGPNLTDIFITSAAKSEPTPVMPAGYDPNTGYFGGALFHINLEIQGKNEYRANIRPRS
jgi:sugar lactone lactonase YvrE